MNLVEAKALLASNRLLRSREEVGKFELAINCILSFQDVNNIKDLCEGFHDDSKSDEVMFGLIHAIESYDKSFGTKLSLKKLADSIPTMYPHAIDWLKIIHKRILNHEISKTIYGDIISSLDNNRRKILKEILYDIQIKNPVKFGTSSQELLKRIE